MVTKKHHYSDLWLDSCFGFCDVCLREQMLLCLNLIQYLIHKRVTSVEDLSVNLVVYPFSAVVNQWRYLHMLAHNAWIIRSIVKNCLAASFNFFHQHHNHHHCHLCRCCYLYRPFPLLVAIAVTLVLVLLSALVLSSQSR